jgi:hypothetical protein
LLDLVTKTGFFLLFPPFKKKALVAVVAMAVPDEKKRPTALILTLILTPVRSSSTDSSSSNSSLKHPRTPRFAEATSIHSPVESRRNPFSEKSAIAEAQPGDVGFGYINNRESVAMAPKSPLKSAMKAPGTPGRKVENPLSPTFKEEQFLEKREAATDKEQARDLVWVTPLICPIN